MRLRTASLLLFLPFLWSAARSQSEQVQFLDVTSRAGLSSKNVCGDPEHKRYTLEVTGNGCAFFDYDRDGLLDILLVNGSTLEGFSKGGDPLCVLYRNLGNGRFEDVTTRANLQQRGWGMGVSIADVDNDGWEDIYLTGFGSNVLYRNNGDGTFSDATGKAGVRDAGWSTGSAFGDYDRDGHVDLYVAHYVRLDIANMPDHGSKPYCSYRGIPVHCGPKGLEPEADRLFKNKGDGIFEDVTATAGISAIRPHYGFMPLWTDYDGDGWLDLFVANDSMPNFLYRNERNGRFREVGLDSGLAVSEDGREQAGMGADAGDFNQDGRIDFFVTNFSDDYYTLYRQDAPGIFTDISTRAGIGPPTWNYLGWGTGFVDFDNDGLLDIFCANGHIYPEVDAYKFGTRYRQKNQLFRNSGNEKFVEVTAEAGSGFLLEKSSRGSAFGDYDNDGDIDILVMNINELPTLLENRGGNRRSWIGFLTEGTRSNRSGIGARIRVRIGPKLWTGEVRSGGGYISQNDRRIRFGLGEASKAERVEVRWPDGKTETFENLEVNRYYLMKEGEPPIEVPGTSTPVPE